MDALLLCAKRRRLGHVADTLAWDELRAWRHARSPDTSRLSQARVEAWLPPDAIVAVAGLIVMAA